MRLRIAFLLAGLLALGFGCMDYNEVLVLKKDGSGSMSMRLAVDKEARAEMEKMAGDMAEAFGGMGDMEEQMKDPFASLDEKRIRARLAEKKSNAELKRYKQYDKGQDEVTEMEIAFSNSDDLRDLAFAMADEEGAAAAEVPFTYDKGGDGLWHFTRNQGAGHGDMGMPGAAGGGMPGGMTGMPGVSPGDAPKVPGLPSGFDPSKLAEMSDDEREKMVADMMKGLQENLGNMEENAEGMQARMEESIKGRKIRFEVRFPGKVVDSNATSVDGNTAVWEYALADMESDTMPDEFHATVKQ